MHVDEEKYIRAYRRGEYCTFNAFVQLLKLKAYSLTTQRTYISEFAQLRYTLKGTDVSSLTPERLKNYFEYCIDNQKLTGVKQRKVSYIYL